jgi:hypothetical protein
MKSNSIFNFSRFVAVLKREFVINGRSLALMAIGSYAALALLMILGNALNIQEHNETPIIAVVVVTVFFSIITTIIGSLAFNSLKSKQGRINMFMLPATALEKVLVHFFIYYLCAMVVLLACVQLADLTRIAVVPLLNPLVEVPGPINFAGTLGKLAIDAYEYGDTTMPFNMAIGLSLFTGPIPYLMGSLIAPRNTWFKVFVVSQVLNWLLTIVGMIIINLFDDSVAVLFKILLMPESMWFLFAFNMVFAIACAFATYWFFCRKDVISRTTLG